MKKLVFAFCMLFGAVAVNAQDSTSTTTPTNPSSQEPTAAMQDQGRVKIKSQELPDAVKSSLESQEYRGWLVNSAYKVDGSVNSSVGNTDASTSDSTSTSGTGTSTSDTTSVGNDQSGSYAQEFYIVELKNGAQTKTVRFDKDGKKLDDGADEMNGDQK